MTPAQQHADKELRRAFVMLPTYAAYLENLPTKNETFTAWRNMLATKCDPADLTAAVDDLHAGHWQPHQRDGYDRFAFLLANRAELKADQRRRQTDADSQHAQNRSDGGADRLHGFASRLRDMMAAKTPEGREEAEARVYDEHERLKADDWKHEPRYVCPDCQDTGAVPCVDPADVARMRRLGLESFNQRRHRMAIVTYACSCERGAGLRSEQELHRWSPIPVYQPDFNFRCLADTDDARQQLEDWLG